MVIRIPEVPPEVREAILLLPNLLKFGYRLLRDPRIPMRRRALALGALAYIASPIDVVPDFVPVLGQVDDALVVVLALHHLLEGADENVVSDHWDGRDDVLDVIGATLAWGADLVPKALRAGVARFLDER